MTTIRLPPVGFWSYARQDDELSQGKLSGLRAIILSELQQQHGRDQIRIFQDANTIAHGAAWEKEIRAALGASTFFIPVVTPNFIQSEWCCREVRLFLEREAELRALHPELPERSRIFPLHFIGIEDVEPADPIALEALLSLQWFDFRRLRHKSFDDFSVGEALADFAASMRDLLKGKVPAPADGSNVTAGTTIGAGKNRAQSDTAPRQVEVGDVLNHMFKVTRFIKAGGMGQVFEGENIKTGERLAIKTLLPALAADPKVIGMMEREALTLTKLRHEALVQYRVMAEEPELGILYIVTEYIDGVDLGEALDRVDRSPEELGRLLGRLAAGLAAAHARGAIHRDISPDNVMLPAMDLHQAKIIDFGIAKDLGGHLPTLIGHGFAGKLNFVAPEQLGEYGGEVGSWTDVYSLALVILSVAKGEKVDMAGSFADALLKRRDGPDLKDAPEKLRPLLAEMLRPDPAERLRTMEDVLARLAGGEGKRDRPEEKTGQVKRMGAEVGFSPGKRHLGWAAAAAALFIFAISVLIIVLRPGAGAAVGTVIEPGRWNAHRKVTAIVSPDFPADVAARLRQTFESAMDPQSCVSAASARNPGVALFDPRGDGHCALTGFTMADGRLNGQLSCRVPGAGDGGTWIARFSGTYTQTAIDIDNDVSLSQPGSLIRMRTHDSLRHTADHCG
jgi:hypothetical protein